MNTAPNPDEYYEWANGVSTDLYGAGGAHCSRIASLFVLNRGDLFNFVEFGWYAGWDPCLDGVWRSTPRVFVSWKLTNEPQDSACYPERSNPQGTWARFTATDGDSNTVWSFYWKGVLLQNRSMDFTDGLAVAQGERKNDDDTAFAHFFTLRYIRYADFINWDALRELKTTSAQLDPGFWCRRLSNTEMQVVAYNPPENCPDGPPLL